MLEYQRVLDSHKRADDPWNELANAVVEVTADDYRRNMNRLIKLGLFMSDMELAIVRSHIKECQIFFESDWGYLLSRGLAPVILEKLQAEFADNLARFEARLPYKQNVQKHRRKLERKREAAERRWLKNKTRRKKRRKKEVSDNG